MMNKLFLNIYNYRIITRQEGSGAALVIRIVMITTVKDNMYNC